MNGSKYRGAIFISISFAQCAALSSPLVILGVLDRSRYGAVLILISLVQPSRHFLRAVSLYIIVARCTYVHILILPANRHFVRLGSLSSFISRCSTLAWRPWRYRVGICATLLGCSCKAFNAWLAWPAWLLTATCLELCSILIHSPLIRCVSTKGLNPTAKVYD